MFRFRHLLLPAALAVVTLASGARASDDKVLLREDYEAGGQWRFRLEMQLSGKILLKSDEKTISLDLRATAQHRFNERVLGLDAEKTPARCARYYEEAGAEITVHGDRQTRTLRPERRLIVAQRSKEATVTYAPTGPLSREELELAGEHFDVLAAHGLLPGKQVAAGEKWEVPVGTAQGLAAVEGIVNHTLVAKLEEVRDGLACISITGNLEGIVHGAENKCQIEGYLWFDVAQKRWTGMRWKQQDERSTGPASPGARMETNTTVVRSFGPKPAQLSDAVAANLPAEPSQGHLLLQYRDGQGRHEFFYERGWQTMTQTGKYTVMRLLERGELVAQLNITPHTQTRPGEHLSAEEFQKHVRELPDFKIDQILQTGEVPAEPKHWIYRMSVAGQASDLNVLQNHFLVAGPNGHQVMLTFTTEVPLVERLGGRDLSIVGTVAFPDK